MNLQVHRNTPTLKVNDNRGSTVRHVEYLRKVIGGPVETLVSRQFHDPIGRLIAQWDPRLFGIAPKPNISTVHGLSGNALRVDSVDAGLRLNLLGVAGQALRRWDGRGCHWQTDYDPQLRMIALHEQPPGQPQTIVERLIYADHSADPGHNLRGQKIALEDPAGRLDFAGFSLLGAPLSETRTFLDGKACSTSWHYSANGAELTRTDAAGHRQHTRFDLAGQLKQSFLQLNDEDLLQPVLQGLTYNAFAQIETKTAGNGVVSTWTYDPADGRLTNQRAGIPGQPLLQNLGYYYDRMGNILRIEDHAFKPVFFANQRVDGHRDFAYDSLSRLIRASGFEVAGATIRPGLPELIVPIDPSRLLNYTERYYYDLGGNLTTLCHQREGNCYTHHLRIAPNSNRGLAWKEDDPEPVFEEGFDDHGNQLMLQKGQPLAWNHRDQLGSATLIKRDTGDDKETYAYSHGVRVHKQLITHAGAVRHRCDVRYLPGLENRTLDDSEELHVITLPGSVRCLHWVKGQPAGIEQDQLRYSLDDHLGSSTLELDRNGAVISHELYSPFGRTCWWAARSTVEASYKTIRYSGKEMDVSGLCYFGLRYCALWLQRWVSADPKGAVDGLNRYAMVGNNPMSYIDNDGGARSGFWERATSLFKTAADVGSKVDDAAKNFDGPDDEAHVTPEIRSSMTFRKYLFSKNGLSAFGLGATVGATLGGAAGTFAPVIGNAIGGVAGGLIGGLLASYVRYRFFKQGIRVAETLQTEQIRNVTRDLSNGANDLANGKLPEALQNKLDDFREKAVTSLMEQLSPLDQLEVLEQMRRGIDIHDALRSKIDGAQNALTEATNVLAELKDQATELGNSASNMGKNVVLMIDEAGKFVSREAPGATSEQRPIPKPRTRRALETAV
ncbi:RHS repeat-associated core domain-containing protein [Pseudomonas fluorescens]|uniref:RHS repeat domain-containing protein n=1 Tax=Pseudomonas fluorescens TaxID=294 RepID=UPI003D04AC41